MTPIPEKASADDPLTQLIQNGARELPRSQNPEFFRNRLLARTALTPQVALAGGGTAEVDEHTEAQLLVRAVLVGLVIGTLVLIQVLSWLGTQSVQSQGPVAAWLRMVGPSEGLW